MIWCRQHVQSAVQIKTSEHEQDQKTNRGLDKGPLWFRIRRELQAAQRKLGWQLGGQTQVLKQGGHVGFIPCADDLQV
jgi:hypothetical protein